MSADEYAPSDEEMLSAYVTGRMMRDGLMRTEAEQEFRCGLARVRRDAAREALLALDQRLEPLGAYQDADGIWTAQGEIADMLATDYPKEAP